MKRKDKNEMWPLQLDDMVSSTLIFNLLVLLLNV